MSESEASETRIKKTLWDWADLLLVPITLLVLGSGFSYFVTQRQNAIEDRRAIAQAQVEADRAQEATLQNYLDEMTNLLLDWELRGKGPADEEWVLAQAWTVTALRQLDETRRNILLEFLNNAELIADPLLFDVGERGSVSDLDAGRLSDALLEQFRDHGVLLTPEALVIVEQEGRTWKIDDGGSVYWIRRNDFGTGAYADSINILRGADLREADLRGAHLSFADLQGAYLSGADLRDAYLREADLSGTNLDGADLTGAYLSEAYLSRANLREAYLSGTNLDGADLREADLREAYLSEAILTAADWTGADLSGADLSDADLRGADLTRAFLRWVDLRGTKIDDITALDDKWLLVREIVNQGAQGRNLSDKDLRWADLSGADLRGTDLRGTDLSEADLRLADLRLADLSLANLRLANLSGADLTGADLSKTGLRFAKYDDDTKWPTDFTPPPETIKQP